jgi:hypothetical protein
MNDPLRLAMDDARLDTQAVAAALGVDPKTVQRWMGGRLPLRRHRWMLADLVHRDEHDLWPEPAAPGPREIVAVYPHRGAVPRTIWLDLLGAAKKEIGILVYAGLFLAEDVELVGLLADKARTGINVRLLIGDPDSAVVAHRGVEEGIGDAMVAKIRNVLVLCRPLLADGAQIRLHETILYNSLYRGDDEMLVNAHVFGAAAAHAPVLHLRRQVPGDLVTTYLCSFEAVWSEGRALT